MIPLPEITRWRKVANWPLDDQVEQDLIISAALVNIFNHPFLKERLAFRGGTAFNKLIFPDALRYSEDIDMNRLENEKIGPVLDALRFSLKGIFSKKAKSERTDTSVKLIYSYESISGGTRNVKIEISVRETLPQKKLKEFPFKVESGFFTGSTNIMAFDEEEMIGTKIRALYQRSKGRDLFDLFELGKLNFDWGNIVDSYKQLDIGATRLDYEKNLEAKMKDQAFLGDIVPLLPNDISYDPQEAHQWFLSEVVTLM